MWGGGGLYKQQWKARLQNVLVSCDCTFQQHVSWSGYSGRMHGPTRGQRPPFPAPADAGDTYSPARWPGARPRWWVWSLGTCCERARLLPLAGSATTCLISNSRAWLDNATTTWHGHCIIRWWVCGAVWQPGCPPSNPPSPPIVWAAAGFAIMDADVACTWACPGSPSRP